MEERRHTVVLPASPTRGRRIAAASCPIAHCRVGTTRRSTQCVRGPVEKEVSFGREYTSPFTYRFALAIDGHCPVIERVFLHGSTVLE